MYLCSPETKTGSSFRLGNGEVEIVMKRVFPKHEKKVKKICRIKKAMYLCSPETKTGFVLSGFR